MYRLRCNCFFVMLRAPPVVFPHSDGKVKPINLPEDVYIKKFFGMHPESKYEDPIKYVLFLNCLFSPLFYMCKQV